MAFPVQGKTALVTGAGSGICFDFASLLLAKGCNVLIADLALRPEAQKLVDESEGKTPKAVFEKTDVTEWGDLERAVAVAVKEFGSIDIFCPGAGVFEPLWSSFWYPPGTPGSVDQLSSNKYKLLDINLTHPIRLSQLAVSHLLARKAPGAIIHISSVSAQIPSPLYPLYAVSKAGISQLIRCLGHLEPQVGIRVSGVAPSLTKTPLFTDNPDKMALVNESKDIWTTPMEVAEAMLSLIESPDMESGTVLEIGPKTTRKVALLNDPGPWRGGNVATNGPAVVGALWERIKNEGI